MRKPSSSCYTPYVLYAFFMVLFSISSVSAETKLTLNAGIAEPFVTKDGGGFYGELVKELFSRLDINAKVIKLPSSRSIINANQGIDAGVIARTEGMEKKYKNLVRVPEAVVKFKFVAYSMDKEIKVSGWDSFKPYSVGIIRGWRIYEKNVKNSKKLTMVSGAEQLFNLLLNKRSELILFEYNRGTWWNEHLKAKAHIIGSPIAVKDMFIYMHKKHAELVPKMAAALAEMKKDGSYARIKNKNLPENLK